MYNDYIDEINMKLEEIEKYMYSLKYEVPFWYKVRQEDKNYTGISVYLGETVWFCFEQLGNKEYFNVVNGANLFSVEAGIYLINNWDDVKNDINKYIELHKSQRNVFEKVLCLFDSNVKKHQVTRGKASYFTGVC